MGMSKGSAPSLFSLAFTSSDQTIAANTTLTLAHGLSIVPYLVQLRIKNTSTDQGYAANDVILINQSDNGSSGTDGNISVQLDATNITIRFATSFSLVAPNKSTNGAVALDSTKWVLIVKAWA